MRKTLTLLSKIFVNIFTILFGIVMLAGILLEENSAAVSSFLGAETQRTENNEEDEEKLRENPLAFEYYASSFKSVSELKENNKKLVENIVAEGSTLLKNENGALPLAAGSKLSLYSISSVNLVYAGTGSSGTNTSQSVNLKAALEKAGFTINESLWSWYNSNQSKYGRGGAGGAVGQGFSINEAPWSVIDSSKENTADAAIFVLARNGGEGKDLTIKNGSGDMTNGNYLELSPNEKETLTNLKSLKASGKIGKIIVLMNTANPVQCDFIDDAAYDIDAMLWCGDLGSTGANAVGDILVGNVNPSGRLSDTFWTKHYYNPVYANWGAYNYTGTVSSGKSNTYVAYQEGIYNGYRYTETRYEDVVLGRSGAGNFVYEDVVSYPFGYGLSYTQFAYSDFKAEKQNMTTKDVYNVSVTVTNTGDKAGKETVQVYLQKPYTDYDVENNVEKAAVELVGFGKTKELKPGDKDTITVSVDGKYFSSYDAYGAKTYIVDAGDYYFATGKDAHDALNNILAAKGKSASDGMTDNGNASMAKKITVANFDDKTYSSSNMAKERGLTDETVSVTNRFDNADLNLYEGKGDNGITYISRNDWEGTVKLGLSSTHQDLGNQVKITATEQMRNEVKTPTLEKDDREYPTYGSTSTSWSLADLRAYRDDDEDVTNDKAIEFNHKYWDELLDQLTWDDTVKLLSDGFRRTVGVDSISKPTTIDHNGATGPVQSYADNSSTDLSKSTNQGLAVRTNDPNKNENPVLYPSNGLCASTYNVELVKEYGRAWGEDCLWSGYNGLYGPGLNMHRGAYGGRSFEYYSEDGVLTGLTAAALTEGMAEKGAYVYLKHCVLNDQELNREGICTWANEQSIREVYLRGFQIAIEEGGAQCVMTGFNRLGVLWTGHQGFCKTVLHDEFGMTGFAVSDWYQSYMTMPAAVLNGNDLPDGTTSGQFDAYKEGYGELAWAMRDAAHRILYTVVQSNAMNGKTAGTRIIQLTPEWVYTVNNIKVASGVLFGASVVFLGVMIFLDKFKPVNKKED